MRMLSTLCAAAMVGAPLTVFAQELSYNYVEAGYVTAEPDEGDVDFDGFRIKVSGQISDPVYVFASYGSLESDSFGPANTTSESTNIVAGLGFRLPLTPVTDLNLEAAYVYAETELKNAGAFSGEDDDSGYGLGIGLRHLFLPQLEGGIKVDYVDVFDDDDTTVTFSGLFHVTTALSLGVAYSTSSDADGWTFGGRFNF